MKENKARKKNKASRASKENRGYNAEKNAIRKKMRQQRDEYDEIMRKKKSSEIMKMLQKQKEYENAEKICVYISKGSEVATHEWIRDILEEGSKKVVVPVTDVQKRKITLSMLSDMRDLKQGTYEILEPQEDKRNAVSPEQVDLFIIPGIAFDGNCSRIGYGGGYYDKLLSTIKKPKIGVAYSFQIVQHIPKEKTDISVDKVITEKEVYGKDT